MIQKDSSNKNGTINHHNKQKSTITNNSNPTTPNNSTTIPSPSSSPTSTTTLLPKLEIILPRSVYYHGETLLGLIHLSLPRYDNNTNIINNRDTNNVMRPNKIQLILIGKCRIDSRWHNTKEVLEFHGIHPVLQQLSNNKEREIVCGSSSSREDTICFYATNIVDLILDDNNGEDDKLTKTDFCYLFGSDLASDLPHSATFSSCKYYYTIIAFSKIGTTSNATYVQSSLPFVIHSSSSSSCCNIHRHPSSSSIHNVNNNVASARHQKAAVCGGGAGARLKIGSCYVLSPSIIPSSVNTSTSSSPSLRNRNNTNCKSKQDNDTKSIRISNEHNIPYCILTLINSTLMFPGSTMELHFQFHKSDTNSSSSTSTATTKIKQITASIQGTEYAFYDDSNYKGCSKKTKTFLLDSTCRTTTTTSIDSIGMTLCLPLDCPYTISTDLVELSIFCTIELILVEDDYTTTNTDYSTIEQLQQEDQEQQGREKKMSYEFPIYVVHNSNSSVSTEEEEEEDYQEEEFIDTYESSSNSSFENETTTNKENNIEEEQGIDVNDKMTHDDLIVLGCYLEENHLLL